MKKLLLIAIIIFLAQCSNTFGQEQNSKNKSHHHGLCFEFWGTSNAYNIQYLLLKKIKNSNLFLQTDAIAGYRRELEGKFSVTHVYNFSAAINGGFLHSSGRSILFGCGLGFDRGRISQGKLNSPSLTNESVVTYIRINYARRVSKERLILGISMVYGFKIYEYYNGLDPWFNRRVDEFQNWFAPAVSIGYCFGKKHFQKEKIE